MAIHIKDPKADQLARELAKVTGESLTEAVTKALEERLARQRKPRSMEQRRAAIEEIVRRFNALPALDRRSPEEMLYDEYGLPK